MKNQKLRSALIVNIVLFVIILLWTIPTIGLLVSSVRERDDIQSSGWWTVIPHRGWVPTGETRDVPPDQTRDAPITIEGVTATYDEWREGIKIDRTTKVVWVGNLRRGHLELYEQKWTANWTFTLDNYAQVLAGKEFEIREAFQDRLHVRPVAGRILDTENCFREFAAQALDQVKGEADAGDLRDVIQINTQIIVGDFVDDLGKIPEQALITHILIIEWGEHQDATDAHVDRVLGQCDGVGQRAGTGAGHQRHGVTWWHSVAQ